MGATQLVLQCGRNYQISGTVWVKLTTQLMLYHFPLFTLGYSQASLCKLQKCLKGSFWSLLYQTTFISFILFHYQKWKHFHYKTKLKTEAYLACVVKWWENQLLNQCTNKSTNCMKRDSHNFVQIGRLIRFVG